MSQLLDGQTIKDIASTLISFSQSFEQNQKQKQSKQSQNESESSISQQQIFNSLYFLLKQMEYNNKCKQIIQIPNFLQSLIKLCNYKRYIHINNEQVQKSQEIREGSRLCLNSILVKGDEQDQSELINVGYGRVLIIYISTAGGTEVQGNMDIYYGLLNIIRFLNYLNNWRNNNHYNKNNNNYYYYYNNQPYFPVQPDLSKSCIEQIEEEGGNEEIESQLINKQIQWNFIDQANKTEAEILNLYIYRRNKMRRWYQ